jgi:glucosamine--fructose-6-phosphate aminotransferase (isomerizing)
MVTFIDEIKQQPEALRNLISAYYKEAPDSVKKLNQLLDSKDYKQIIFTGMGSSLFASLIPCIYLRSKGIMAYAMETNELMQNSMQVLSEDTLLVIVSQSGESREVVQLCKLLECQGNVVVVTNYMDKTLYRYGSVKFEIFAGLELTTATKSFTNTIAALDIMALLLSNGSESELMELKDKLCTCADMMKQIIDNASTWLEPAFNFIDGCTYMPVVASGNSYCTASHAELVVEEAGKINSSRYTLSQFLHGPLELIGDKFICLMIDTDPELRDIADKVLNCVVDFGGKILVISNRDYNISSNQVYNIKIDYLDSLTSPIAEILPLELLINYYGIKKGLNPGIINRVVK